MRFPTSNLANATLTCSREFCMRHPEIRDVCDLGQMIFWNKKWAFYFTAVMFILNSEIHTAHGYYFY